MRCRGSGVGGIGSAVIGADHGEEALDGMDHGVRAFGRHRLEGVLGSGQLGVHDRLGRTAAQLPHERLRLGDGTSESLVPWSTKNGGAWAPTWLIGEACSQRRRSSLSGDLKTRVARNRSRPSLVAPWGFTKS